MSTLEDLYKTVLEQLRFRENVKEDIDPSRASRDRLAIDNNIRTP